MRLPGIYPSVHIPSHILRRSSKQMLTRGLLSRVCLFLHSLFKSSQFRVPVNIPVVVRHASIYGYTLPRSVDWLRLRHSHF